MKLNTLYDDNPDYIIDRLYRLRPAIAESIQTIIESWDATEESNIVLNNKINALIVETINDELPNGYKARLGDDDHTALIYNKKDRTSIAGVNASYHLYEDQEYITADDIEIIEL